MEIRTEKEARENVENFTKEYLKLLLHKKTIDQEIKDMKNNYKEDGVFLIGETEVVGNESAVLAYSHFFEQDLRRNNAELFPVPEPIEAPEMPGGDE